MVIKNLAKNFFDRFKKILIQNTKNFDGPIVIYSSILPICISYKLKADKVSFELLKILKLLKNKNHIFVPTFFNTKSLKIIDLDNHKSSCGYFSEYFRLNKETYRTKCPFFPFSVVGRSAKNFQEIDAHDVWGQDSISYYLYKNNAKIITLGVHPTHCSISHLSEWINRDKINYRNFKIIKKKLIFNGKIENFKRKLFVRKFNIQNNFEKYLNDYKKHGMKIYNINDILISFMNAKKKINFLSSKIKKNKNAVI
jgi:aminoglycoside N3'-acetyltransferase